MDTHAIHDPARKSAPIDVIFGAGRNPEQAKPAKGTLLMIALLPSLLVSRRPFEEGEHLEEFFLLWISGGGTVLGTALVVIVGHIAGGGFSVGAAVNVPNGSFEVAIAVSASVCFGELVVEGSFRVVGERSGRLSDDVGGRVETHLFAFEIAFEGIEEETVVGD
jgi:hypothetical protein